MGVKANIPAIQQQLGEIPRTRTGRFHDIFNNENEDLEEEFEYDLPDEDNDSMSPQQADDHQSQDMSFMDDVSLEKTPISQQQSQDMSVTDEIFLGTTSVDHEYNEYNVRADALSISSSSTPTQATVSREPGFNRINSFVNNLVRTSSFASVNEPPATPSSFAGPPPPEDDFSFAIPESPIRRRQAATPPPITTTVLPLLLPILLVPFPEHLYLHLYRHLRPHQRLNHLYQKERGRAKFPAPSLKRSKVPSLLCLQSVFSA